VEFFLFKNNLIVHLFYDSKQHIHDIELFLFLPVNKIINQFVNKSSIQSTNQPCEVGVIGIDDLLHDVIDCLVVKELFSD
jgi:hypothetical protein